MTKKHDTSQVQNELNQSKFFIKSNPSGKDLKDLDKDLLKDTNKDLDVHTKQDGSKDVHPPTNTPAHHLPTTEEVEEMVFHLRKTVKVRVNGDLPEDWKMALDEYAHQSGVGKYHLVMYAVGKMLGKI
jgi:hypothetical protein